MARRKGPNIVSEKRKQAARKHADRIWTCKCGKECRGNGGKTSHQRACNIWNNRLSNLGPVGPGFGARWS